MIISRRRMRWVTLSLHFSKRRWSYCADVLEIHETGRTNAAGFGWYNDLPTGIERLLHRSDPLRRSISWFVHRLPRQTETVTDYSRDPVVSLEIGSFGAIERR